MRKYWSVLMVLSIFASKRQNRSIPTLFTVENFILISICLPKNYKFVGNFIRCRDKNIKRDFQFWISDVFFNVTIVKVPIVVFVIQPCENVSFVFFSQIKPSELKNSEKKKQYILAYPCAVRCRYKRMIVLHCVSRDYRKWCWLTFVIAKFHRFLYKSFFQISEFSIKPLLSVLSQRTGKVNHHGRMDTAVHQQ